MRILGIGTATLDIINRVDHFPAEDEELRALGQQRVRGGNAANTLVVLSQLGHDCAWGGVIAEEPDSGVIRADLRAYGVDLSPCVRHPGGKAPTSYILLSDRTGSRTIVHYRDLPEFSAQDFMSIELGGWDWLHFEGREPQETVQMLAHAKQRQPALRCSLEIEKPRAGIERLFLGPEVLMFSKAYAQAKGFRNGPELLQAMRPQTGSAILFCAWGEAGAFAMDAQGRVIHSPAYVPASLVDTLGAGDVFNAAVIDGLLRASPLEEILLEACRLAGRKCGVEGLSMISE